VIPGCNLAARRGGQDGRTSDRLEATMPSSPVIDKFLHAIETATIPGCDAWDASACSVPWSSSAGRKRSVDTTGNSNGGRPRCGRRPRCWPDQQPARPPTGAGGAGRVRRRSRPVGGWAGADVHGAGPGPAGRGRGAAGRQVLDIGAGTGVAARAALAAGAGQVVATDLAAGMLSRAGPRVSGGGGAGPHRGLVRSQQLRPRLTRRLTRALATLAGWPAGSTRSARPGWSCGAGGTRTGRRSPR
jgi:hypothetical protein